jgi:hypothetical protein
VAGAEQLRAGDRGQADRAGPDDGDDVARAVISGSGTSSQALFPGPW